MPLEQAVEHLKTIAPVFCQRVSLTEGAQGHALTQPHHVLDVLAPELVEHLQRDLPLGHAHGVAADLRCLGGHVLVEFFEDAVDQNLVVDAVFRRPFGDW